MAAYRRFAASATPYDIGGELVDFPGLTARTLKHVPSIAFWGPPSSLWKFKRPHHPTAQ
jgi:hypothetical protein